MDETGILLPLSGIIVYNVNTTITDGVLYKELLSFGPIYSLKITKKTAYVSYFEPSDAALAVNTLNKTEFEGNTLKVLFGPLNHPSVYQRVGVTLVTNLNLDLNEEHLKAFFFNYGHILHCKLARNKNNVSRKYAFIHFLHRKSMKRAIEECNRTLLNGSLIGVEEYDPRINALDHRNTYRTIFIENFSYDFDREDLEDFFVGFGPIVSCYTSADVGEDKKIGYITFANTESARLALTQTKGIQLNGVDLVVGISITKDEMNTRSQTKKVANIKQHYRQIYFVVENLDPTLSDGQLQSEFNRFGKFDEMNIIRNPDCIYAYLCCSNAEHARRIIGEIAKSTLDPEYEFKCILNDFDKLEVTDKLEKVPVIAKASLNIAPDFVYDLVWEVAITPYQDLSQKWKLFRVLVPYCNRELLFKEEKKTTVMVPS